MSEEMKAPNPGSDEAISLGCKCPVIDNGHGRGWMGGIKDDDGETIFVYTVGCPVHTQEAGIEVMEIGNE